MAYLEPLAQPHDLQTNYIAQLRQGAPVKGTLIYDDAFDALIVLLIPNDREFDVYYLEGDIAFLVLPDSLEIVGLQIEAFERTFVSRHKNLATAWTEFRHANVDDWNRKRTLLTALKSVLEDEFGNASDQIDTESAYELIAVLA